MIAALLSGILVASASPAGANLFTKIVKMAEEAGDAGKLARHGLPELQDAHRLITALPSDLRQGALAARVTPEGHWRLVNAAGEVATAATPEELASTLRWLVPEAAETPGGRISFYLEPETAMARKSRLDDLPKGAQLQLVFDGTSFPLIRSGTGETARVFAEIRDYLVVELTDQSRFGEAVWQLRRPLRRADLRVLSLDPQGPSRLPGAARFEADAKVPAPEAANPFAFAEVMRSLRGQTVVITGQVDGALLKFEPLSGGTRTVHIAELFAAAARFDVNLVLINATSARQPGVRNWLLQPAGVAGLEEAASGASMGDFFGILASSRGRLLISATADGGSHVRVTAMPAESVLPPASGRAVPGRQPSLAEDVFAEIVSNATGQVLTSGIEAAVTSQARQQELDDRIIPGIPSAYQFGYLGLLVLGFVGAPVALGWWRRLWPLAARASYRSALRYWLMRVIRLPLFVLLWLPAVSLPALVVLALRQIGAGLRLVWAILTWPFRRLSSRTG
jgi:hypothetical protein